jgi:hypothetical protein
MLMGAMKKVMWVGRATVFVVGLAVIVTVVFWVGSMALGSNGQPFMLGKSNAAAKPPGTTTSKPTAAKTLWAVINANGTTARASGVKSSQKEANSTGEYDVIFKRNVSGCAYVASFADPRQTGEVSASSLTSTPNGVYVQTVTNTGTNEVPSDRPFHLAVFC